MRISLPTHQDCLHPPVRIQETRSEQQSHVRSSASEFSIGARSYSPPAFLRREHTPKGICRHWPNLAGSGPQAPPLAAGCAAWIERDAGIFLLARKKGPPASAGGRVVGGVKTLTRRRGPAADLPSAYESFQEASRFLIETPDLFAETTGNNAGIAVTVHSIGPCRIVWPNSWACLPVRSAN